MVGTNIPIQPIPFRLQADLWKGIPRYIDTVSARGLPWVATPFWMVRKEMIGNIVRKGLKVKDAREGDARYSINHELSGLNPAYMPMAVVRQGEWMLHVDGSQMSHTRISPDQIHDAEVLARNDWFKPLHEHLESIAVARLLPLPAPGRQRIVWAAEGMCGPEILALMPVMAGSVVRDAVRNNVIEGDFGGTNQEE